jgi:hypothetical protein
MSTAFGIASNLLRKEGTAHDPHSGQFTSSSGKGYSVSKGSDGRHDVHDEDGKHVGRVATLSNSSGSGVQHYGKTDAGSNVHGPKSKLDPASMHAGRMATAKMVAEKHEKSGGGSNWDTSGPSKPAGTNAQQAAAARRKGIGKALGGVSNVHVFAEFQKSSIDVAQRSVTGVAQFEDETPDTQGDIVDFNASVDAFREWAGNVREMHAPKAVGKSVKIWSDPILKRIYVTSRISEGAEDTWLKVLDGTLSGYSIGGQQLAATRGINKFTRKPENRITKYRLNELSLVDSPANPHCVITAIHKRNGVFEATDVLQGAPSMANIAAAKSAIRNFTKSIDGDGEVILLRKSDLESRADGLIVLKKTAACATIRKDDMDAAAGAAPESGTDSGDPNDLANIDLEDHATNMANAHKDLCTMSGIDDHVGHYEDATQGDDDAQQDGDGQIDTGADGGDMAMSRRSGNMRKSGRRTRRTSDRDIQKRIDAALGKQASTMQAAFASQIDEIKKSIGAGAQNQTRKGADGEGTPLEKTVGDLVGDGANLSKGSSGRYTELVKAKAETDAKIETMLAKMKSGHKLSTTEDIERQQLGKQSTRIDVEMSELAARALTVAV